MRIIKRENNLGLANSVIFGVTKVLEENDRIIVLEDDLYRPIFFVHESVFGALRRLNVAHSRLFIPIKSASSQHLFKGAACWGWSTWKKKWESFECDSETLLRKFTRETKEEFNHYNHFDYFKMLELQA